MKTKHLLLVLVMLMFTALNAIAQNVTDKPNSEKLLPPNLMNSPGNSSQQMMQPDLNKLLMQAIKTHDKNAIKKTLDDYRQKSKDQSNSQALYNKGNNSVLSNASSTSDFHLTKDINALSPSNPSNGSDVYPNPSYAILKQVIYFAADDGAHSSQLWRSDGTTAGTFIVKDIEHGDGYFPYSITAINGKLYFSAYTASYGFEPWVSDGTESGTQMLMDLNPGPGGSNPEEFIGLGNTVYFTTDDFVNGDGLADLWKTDGTAASTKLIRDFSTTGNGVFLTQLTRAKDFLFFTIYGFSGAGGPELWRSDGTNEGTYHVGTNAVFSDYPHQLTNYNQKLYFSADDGTGNKLWVTDGTDAGTTLAPNNNGILINEDYAHASGFGVFFGTFPILNNILYIPGSTLTSGSGLYKYDASNTRGVVLVKDLTRSADADVISSIEMKVVNNTLYFRVNDSIGGFHYELWSSKGTEESTKIINKFLPEETIYDLYSGNGTLYFVKQGKALGTELWKILATSYGALPMPIDDIFRGPTGSYPDYLTAFKGKLFFSATDGVKGTELLKTNNFDLGAILVKDINTFSTSSSDAGRYINALIPLGNKVLFNGFEKAHGRELYTSDGTASGTLLLNDIVPGETGSNPGDIITKNNFGYFIAASSDTANCIFKTDGLKNSLQKVSPDYNKYSYFIAGFNVANNGLVFYVLHNYNTAGNELWRSDGTAAGTFLLSSTVYASHYLNVVGNTAFFVGNDAVHGNELWKSNGSVAGTKMVKDINPGTGNSSPKGMVIYKNEVYFAANNGTDASFWKSDGTEAGTIQLRQIDPWYSSSVFSTARYYFEISNDILYFSAIDYANAKGTQLWRTDGTVAGTKVVKDISPDADSYYPIPFYLTDVNGTLFFTTNSGGVSGTELWKSNGTKEGTQLVKNITPGADASGLNNLTGFGGKLYFTNSGALWSSDGTAGGTTLVDDAGISDVYVYNIVAASDQLFLSGSTQQYGIELYAGKPGATGKFVASKSTNENALKTSLPFSVVLYPNPAKNTLNIKIAAGNSKNVTLLITDVSGKTMLAKSMFTGDGEAITQLDVSRLSAGTYFVKIMDKDGSENGVIKFVKQ